MKNDSCTIANFSVKLNNNWNIFATFLNPLNPMSGKSFERLPKKLLETFRVLNFTTPEYVYIIRSFLFTFGVEADFCVLAKKIVLFFDLIVTNIGNKLFLFKEDLNKNDIKKTDFGLVKVNLVHIVKILRLSRESFLLKSKNDENTLQQEIMRQIRSFLKPLVSSNHWDEVSAILQNVFGKVSEEKPVKNKEKSKLFKENLSKFLHLNGLVKTKKFIKNCKILLEMILQENCMFLCGKVGRSKSTIIRAVAFIYSVLKGIFFFFFHETYCGF